MKWLLRTALWFAFGHALIVACSDAAILEPKGEKEDGNGGSGGNDPGVTPSTGGRASGGAKTSPPVPGTGGRFGAGGSPIPGTGGSPTVVDASICPPPTVMSLEAYCSQYPEGCHISPAQFCLADQPGVPNTVKESVEQGCGYLRFIVHDEVTGSRFGIVYDQVRGQLVHSWTEPMPCYSVVNVGTMPACSAWSFIPCGSLTPRDAGVLDAATD